MLKAYTDSGKTWDLHLQLRKIEAYHSGAEPSKELLPERWTILFWGPCEYNLEDFLDVRHSTTDKWGLDAGGRNFGVEETVWINYSEACEELRLLAKLITDML